MKAGPRRLAKKHLTAPTDKGAHAGLRMASLVAEMVAGADSIDDLSVARHGGMGRICTKAYASSTLGSQPVDAIASITRSSDVLTAGRSDTQGTQSDSDDFVRALPRGLSGPGNPIHE